MWEQLQNAFAEATEVNLFQNETNLFASLSSFLLVFNIICLKISLCIKVYKNLNIGISTINIIILYVSYTLNVPLPKNSSKILKKNPIDV